MWFGLVLLFLWSSVSSSQTEGNRHRHGHNSRHTDHPGQDDPTDVQRAMRQWLKKRMVKHREDISELYRTRVRDPRKKRSMGLGASVPADEANRLWLRGVVELTQCLECKDHIVADQHSTVSGMTAFNFSGDVYLGFIRNGPWTNSNIYRFDTDLETFHPHDSVLTHGAQGVATGLITDIFTDSPHVLMAVTSNITNTVAGYYAPTATIYRKASPYTGFERRQSIINPEGRSATMFRYDGHLWLAVATYSDPSKPEGHQKKFQYRSRIFRWEHGHFDVIYSIQTEGAMDIEHLEMSGESYLAVANHRTFDTFCTLSFLYKLDSETDEYELYQNFDTCGASDFEHFEMGGHHYLAVANQFKDVTLMGYQHSTYLYRQYQIDSVIYWWAGSQFIEWQVIPTIGITQWESLRLPNNEVVLIAANSQGPMVLYQYDESGQFLPVPLEVSLPTHVSVVQAMTIQQRFYLVTVSSRNDTRSNVFRLEFSGQREETAEDKGLDEARAMVKKLSEKTKVLQGRVKEIRDRFDKIMTVTDHQTVTGNHEYEYVEVEHLVVQNLRIVRPPKPENSTEQNVTSSRPQGYKETALPGIIKSGPAKLDLSGLEKHVSRNGRIIGDIKERMEDVIMMTDGPGVIKGTKTFAKGLTVGELIVEEVTTSGLVNGVDFVELDRSVVKRTGDQKIQGNLIIHGDVNIAGDVEVSGTTNNVSMDDLVLIHGNSNLTAEFTFSGSPAIVVNGDVEVKGEVNGLSIPSDLVLVYGDQDIAGMKTFDANVTVDGNMEMGLYSKIDGIDVSEFASQVVLLNENQTINGSLIFDNLTIDGDLLSDGLVNGVDIVDLADKAVYKDTDQVIHGVQIFNGTKGLLLNITGDMTVEGRLNDYLIPDDYVTTSTDQVLTGSWTITGDLHVSGDVEMEGSLGWTEDGQVTWIDLSQDAVLMYGEQNITGHKTFTNNITVVGNMDMSEGVTIDGVDVSELAEKSAKKNEATIIEDFVIFQNDVNASDVILNGTLNGVDISEFAEQVFTKSGNQTILTKMTFKNLTLGDLDISGLLDGKEVPGNLVTTATDQVISGSWQVDGDVDIAGHLVLSEGVTVGGVDYSEVDRTVVKVHGNQTIAGEVQFAGNVTFSDIELQGLFNGLNIPKDLVLKHGDQHITGHKIFLGDVYVMGDLYAEEVSTTDRLINDVDIVQLAEDAVMLEGDQNITGQTTFLSDIEVLGDLTVEGLVNGVDLEDLTESVVTLSTDQVLEGDFLFMDDVEFLGEDVEINNTVNGVDLAQFAEEVVHMSDEVIMGSKTFSGDVVIMGHLEVDEVNEVDILNLSNSVLYKSRPQVLSGHKTFNDSFTCDNLDVVGDSLIDGVNLSEVLTLSGNHTVYGDVTFYNTVYINSSLTVDGLIDGVNLTELNASAVRLNADHQTISGNKTFHNLTISGDVTIDGSTNNIVDWEKFCNSLMTITADQQIHGRIVIEGDLNIVNLQVNTINAVNMHDFLHNTMLKSANQTITTPQVIFSHPDGLTVKGDLRVEGDVVLSSGGTINGVDVSELYKDMVHQGWDEDISGHKTFANNLVVQSDMSIPGLINGINISDAVLLHTDQNISAHVTFAGDLEVDGSIAVTGLVDGVDVSALASRVVTLSTDQEISGQVTFKDLEITGNLKVDQTLNGFKFPEDFVNVGEDQIIRGKKTFVGDVIIEKDLQTEELYGINLDRLYGVVHKHFKRLEKFQSNTYNESITFGGKVYIHGDVTLHGPVEGLNLSAVPDLPDVCDPKHSQLSNFRHQLQALCPVINDLIDRTSGLPQQISYFNIIQTIKTPGAVKGSFFQPDPNWDHWFIVLTPVPNADRDTDPCSASLGYICGEGDPYCQPFPELSLPTHNPSSIEFYTVHDMPFIIWLNRGSGTLACLDFLPPAAPYNEVSVILSPVTDSPMVIPTRGATDLVMFGSAWGVYLVVANSYDEEMKSSNTPSAVFKMIRQRDDFAFTWVQSLSTVGASAMDVLQVDSTTYLCVANHHDSDTDTGHLMSQVFVWDSAGEQFSLLHEFPTYYAVDCDLFEIKGKMFVAWAQHNPRESPDMISPVIIYRYDSFAGQFEDVILQTLQVPGAYDVEFFSAYGNWYLSVVVSDGRVRLFKWAGVNAFTQDPFYLDLQGAQDVEMMSHKGDVYMLVPAYLSSDSGENTADTVLLKAYIEGSGGSGLSFHPCEGP
ncbi:uncharacterized protein LOC144920128 isoform X2 [Branchiostoma floridae x Branchiostoma belcheri]